MALVPTLKTWLLVVPALALLGVVGYRAGGHVRHDDTVPGTVDEAPVSLVSAAPMQAQQLARRIGVTETALRKAEAKGRRAHEMMICRSVTNRLRAPRFTKRLAQLMTADDATSVSPASES